MTAPADPRILDVPRVGGVVRVPVSRRGAVRGEAVGLSITIALDVAAIEEQADIEADDAPAGADRAWWAR